MVKVGGYANRLAWVDLANKKVDYQELDEDIARKYLGGRGRV